MLKVRGEGQGLKEAMGHEADSNNNAMENSASKTRGRQRFVGVVTSAK